jgi:hypothetical protein
MTLDQLEAYGYDEMTKLERVYGKSLDEKLHAAAVMIHDLDLKTPGLKNLVRGQGIGDNALIVAQLIQQATIYHARRKGR